MKWTYAIAAALLIAQPTWSATLSIQRSSDPATVATATPVAVVNAGPFDDAAGLLSDPNTYYYLVLDGAQQPQTLSVHKQPFLDTVRIGFDDQDAQSAPVHSGASIVNVSPATLPADGASFSTVVIEPCDSTGILLGAGLTVAIDEWTLWPGALAGPVVDLGDGRYEAHVLSDTPGDATVLVDVEGQWLDTTPTIVFQAVSPLTLKDLAILQIDDLTETGGLFDDLTAGLNPNDSPGKELLEAKDEALDALANLMSGDPQADADALGDDLKTAMDTLEDLVNDPGPLDTGALAALVDYLLDAARLVASYWLEQAEQACGPCSGSNPVQVCKAVDELDNGDDRRAEGDYDNAVQGYGKSVEESVKALDSCN